VVAPSFVSDAVYQDTFHIQHASGLSSINICPLLDDVLLGGDGDVGSTVTSLIATDGYVDEPGFRGIY
jgi:hypothetical protein